MTGALESPKGKDQKAQEQKPVEMADPSMFEESIRFNESIAGVDAELEDIVNEAHQ